METRLTYIKIIEEERSVLIENISPYYEYGTISPIYSVDDARALVAALQRFITNMGETL